MTQSTSIHPTTIEWCTRVWNPVVGCLRGCPYCYARSLAKRFGELWAKSCPDSLDIEIVGALLSEFYPIHCDWRMGGKHPKGKTIFVNSMSDPAYWQHDWTEAILDEIGQHPENTYIMLSKTPLYLIDYEIPNNLLYGITIANQAQMDEAIAQGNTEDYDIVNYEPLLESIDTGEFMYNPDVRIIIGAETGNRKGKVTPQRAWVQALVEDAQTGAGQLHIKPSIIKLFPEYDRPEWREVIK